VIAKLLIVAATWILLTGDVSPANLVFALVLAALAVAIAAPLRSEPLFARVRPLKLLGLLVYLAGQIVVANLKVAAAVVGPRRLWRPALVAVPLDAKTDGQIAALSNFVTLTPGTLSLDVSPDRKTLYVHAMSASSPEEVRRDIKDGFERRVMEAFG
jgi:multicomponent Na+:H+ antiporter subunit E